LERDLVGSCFLQSLYAIFTSSFTVNSKANLEMGAKSVSAAAGGRSCGDRIT
jgi:hypothetical protein